MNDEEYMSWLDTQVAELVTENEDLRWKLKWYETKFKPPVQPPTEAWMAEMEEEE